MILAIGIAVSQSDLRGLRKTTEEDRVPELHICHGGGRTPADSRNIARLASARREDMRATCEWHRGRPCKEWWVSS